jgi:hypothetical protein
VGFCQGSETGELYLSVVSFSNSGTFVLHTMARCKNVRGSSSGPTGGDEGDRGGSPPRLTEVARGKHRLLSMKKHTREE